MTDWATISSLATAGGTLVLAIATFSATRSSNRSARTAERALLVGLRPVLMPSRPTDPGEKIGWVDRHWTKVEGGLASVEVVDDNIYLAMSLRNVGAGIAVLQGWDLQPNLALGLQTHADPETFRRLTRDLYVPVGDVGFWQGAIRDPTDPMYPGIRKAIEEREPFTIDLLYSDHEGGQRAISRFTINPRQDTGWMHAVVRHWNLDRQDPH